MSFFAKKDRKLEKVGNWKQKIGNQKSRKSEKKEIKNKNVGGWKKKEIRKEYVEKN